MKRSSIYAITAGAVAIAMSAVLSMLPFRLPQGGGINGSMIPILVYCIVFDTKKGLITATAYALVQLVTGFYPPPAGTASAFFLAVTLDYLLGFGVIGLGGVFYRFFSSRLGLTRSMITAAFSCYFLRFLCSFLSGLLVWQSYAPPEVPVWIYSSVYNGSYMLAEFVLTAVLFTVAGKGLVGAIKKPAETFSDIK